MRVQWVQWIMVSAVVVAPVMAHAQASPAAAGSPAVVRAVVDAVVQSRQVAADPARDSRVQATQTMPTNPRPAGVYVDHSGELPADDTAEKDPFDAGLKDVY